MHPKKVKKLEGAGAGAGMLGIRGQEGARVRSLPPVQREVRPDKRSRLYGSLAPSSENRHHHWTITGCGKYGVEFCRTKMDEDTMRRMAVILPQLQAAAVALKDEKLVPMILVEGINLGPVEQKAQAVLLREPTVRE